MSSIIQVDKVSKWYGNILGVSEISLEIGPGIKGLLGPNGAGKSTFLKLACGQLKANIGAVRIWGEPIFGNPRLFMRIGYCPEHDSYYSEMSGRRFLRFMAELRGVAGAALAVKIEKALAAVGLLESQDRLIRTYSFGMRQRLRLATSIIHDPELLLLDEPLRGVDPLWRIRIIKLIKEFEREGRTIIVSSHILPEIEAMTNNIILIHQGKIFAEGDIHEIRSLIDAHPNQISLRLPEPRRLAEKMVGLEAVQGVEVDPQTAVITFKTAQRDKFYDKLMQIIVAERLDVEEITAPDDNLQAIFDYLIGR